MNDADLITRLVVVAYDSGYYSGRKEDGQSHHMEAIEERRRLRDKVLQRLADLRAALERILDDYEGMESACGSVVRQAHAALEAK
jgi:hypothetical protein